MKKYHFKSISEQSAAFGIRPPEHPLFDVIRLDSAVEGGEIVCDDSFSISSEFYSISLKQITSGEILYGRTKYDCSNGTMIFVAPEQVFSSRGIKVQSVARTICFHEDYVRGHAIHAHLKQCQFFGYAVNEALHLSPREQQQMATLFDAIEVEYHNNQDAFTKELILSQLATLLKYADRFYHRQFLMRKESEASVYERFTKVLNNRIDALGQDGESIPEVEELAASLNMTSRYLSDALKAETGRTTKDWIQRALIERSKDLLLASNDSVATIAYALGFEYPQYFSRLFRNKVGLTPTEYRQKNRFH